MHTHTHTHTHTYIYANNNKLLLISNVLDAVMCVRRRPWLKYFVVSQTLSSNVCVCVYAINNNSAQGRRILLLLPLLLLCQLSVLVTHKHKYTRPVSVCDGRSTLACARTKKGDGLGARALPR